MCRVLFCFLVPLFLYTLDSQSVDRKETATQGTKGKGHTENMGFGHTKAQRKWPLYVFRPAGLGGLLPLLLLLLLPPPPLPLFA